MLRAVVLGVTLCFSCFAPAQKTQSNSDVRPASAVEVVYVIDGSTLTTYNVDPQTLQATQMGTLTLQQSVYPGLATSPDGHFLYYTAYANYSQQGERLWVYTTDASGAPQSPPVQQLNASGLLEVLVNPARTYLYAVYAGKAGTQYTPYTIQRYAIDPATGAISQREPVAKYELSSGTGGGEYCGLGVMGFSASGNKMYDEVVCSYHGGASATYNERDVNLQTGALGADIEVYSWNNDSGGGEFVQFANNLLFDFVIPNNYEQGVNVVNVYPVQPNVSTPLIQCTTSMLAACGYGPDIAHPSGKYVFLLDSQSNTEIGKVDTSNQQIVATSSTIPYEVQQFSPDGTIAFAANDVNGALEIEIYGFNVGTGSVTAGGMISVASDLDSWFTAQRY